jgi:hypothetical protein
MVGLQERLSTGNAEMVQGNGHDLLHDLVEGHFHPPVPGLGGIAPGTGKVTPGKPQESAGSPL